MRGALRAAVAAFVFPLSAADFVGSEKCAPCHAGIYEQYSSTPMARASGLLTLSGARGAVLHKNVRYAITRGAILDFESDRAKGRTAFSWTMGAGVIAKSFLIQTKDGFLFQAPVTHYTRPDKWDLSPGYESYSYIALNRPIEPECLACHAGRLQPRPGTQNGYLGARPFLENGVGCERCHGPGSDHVKGAGKPALVVPSRLDSARRDSLCNECHMGGAVRVWREGRAPGNFRAGELLSDAVAVFGPSDSPAEQLAASRCAQQSGGKMWCGSCHSPHGPTTDYRAKCQACHEPKTCERGPDCVSCHMPKSGKTAIPHSAYTDHRIQRKPAAAAALTVTLDTFRPLGSGFTSRDRGLALAKYGIQNGRAEFLDEAFATLRRIESQLDADALMHLAFLYDRRGEEAKAQPLYERALRLDPSKTEAAVNLGSILAGKGDIAGAAKLWADALTRNPGLESAALKLAAAQVSLGDREAAAETIRKIREFVPDLQWQVH